MAAPRKHPPLNALADIEMLACRGWSIIGLAKHFGVSRPLIVRWFVDHPHFEDAYEQGRDTYRQTLEEQIIQMTLNNKNPAGLIYLLKAKFKMYDQPSKIDPVNVDVKLAPVLVVHSHGTDEQWAAKAAEQQRMLTGGNAVPAVPLIEASLAPAYAPPAMPSYAPPSWKQNA